jgi:hypothetical protein
LAGAKKGFYFPGRLVLFACLWVVVTKLKPSLLFDELRQAFCLSLKKVKLF